MSGSPHDFAADAFHAGQLYRSCFRELTESCGSTACATRTTAVWCTCTCLMKDTLPPKRSITAVKPLR